ncbi:MAG: glycosyltransferase family 1 protein [Gemmatimonadota bacterium]
MRSDSQQAPLASIRIGIDASNLRAGGGITYLKGILGSLPSAPSRLESVTLWGGRSTLDQLPDVPRLTKVPLPHLDGELFRFDWKFLTRTAWQWTELPRLLARANCHILLQPGGTLTRSGRGIPAVTISRNMLPFSPREMRQYGFSLDLLRLLLLRAWQLSSFTRADGVIFLTPYAREIIEPLLPPSTSRKVRVIPHGVGEGFHPAAFTSKSASPDRRAFRWVYVSTVDAYKHHREVVEAMAILNRMGYSATVDFWGHHRDRELTDLLALMQRLDPGGTRIQWRGATPYSDLPELLRSYDGFIFASSCENLPHTLLEAMASGLPIVCSSAEPMPQILGDGGIYFHPERPHEVARAMASLQSDPELRKITVREALERSGSYTWARSAAATWEFLLEVATPTSPDSRQ